MSEAALGRWPVKLDWPVQWGDMDAFAHVNSAVYLRWFESGRIAYFEKVAVPLPEALREGITALEASAG